MVLGDVNAAGAMNRQRTTHIGLVQLNIRDYQEMYLNNKKEHLLEWYIEFKPLFLYQMRRYTSQCQRPKVMEHLTYYTNEVANPVCQLSQLMS